MPPRACPPRKSSLLLLLHFLKQRLHVVHGRLQLLWIANALREYRSQIEERAAKIAIGLGQGWAIRRACCRNGLRKVNRIHTPTSQGLMRISHEPEAIASVGDVTRR